MLAWSAAMESFDEMALRGLKATYEPRWHLWLIHLARQGRTVWCARPPWSRVATVSELTPEAMVAAIREQDQAWLWE